jgi:hypothetical protein
LQIPTTSVAYEYQVSIFNGSSSIYYGSMQVYASQSVNKVDYVNQNTQYKSKLTGNEFIIMNQ